MPGAEFGNLDRQARPVMENMLVKKIAYTTEATHNLFILWSGGASPILSEAYSCSKGAVFAVNPLCLQARKHATTLLHSEPALANPRGSHKRC